MVEAVLNHVSGHRAGVAGVYNRSLYAAEKRDALVRWGSDVENLVSSQPPLLVLLKRARSAVDAPALRDGRGKPMPEMLSVHAPPSER